MGSVTLSRLRLTGGAMNPHAVRLLAVFTTLCLISTGLLWGATFNAVAATDYTMTGETANTGTSILPAYRNAEDSTYNIMVEEDTVADTNFSASSEDVTYGTAGGGSFPDALNTDDSSRRSYTEEDTSGAPPASYEDFLFPTSDVQAEWDTVYPSGDHYAQVDETTEGSDESTTYLATTTTNDEDRFGMADLGDPGDAMGQGARWLCRLRALGKRSGDRSRARRATTDRGTRRQWRWFAAAR